MQFRKISRNVTLHRSILSILLLFSLQCGKGAIAPEPTVVEKYLQPQLEMPLPSVPGGTYQGDVALTFTTPVGGATIYYTTDGTNPTASSLQYAGAIPISGHGSSVTVKAFASLSGFLPSKVFSGTYQIEYTQIGDVSPSILPGVYNTAQSITLSCLTPGTSIYYTTDGSDPTASSTLYTSPISLNGNGTTLNLKARAFKANMLASSVWAGSYVLNLASAGTPYIWPTYNANGAQVEMFVYYGETIRYTTDGSTPSETVGTIYTGPFTVTEAGTIKAISYKTDLVTSSVASRVITLTTATPTISPESQTSYEPLNITMSTATSGAQIRYTTDGSDPTSSSGTLYTGPITADSAVTIRAIAYRTGWTSSGIRIANYAIEFATPFFLTEPGSYCRPQAVGIHTVTKGATIRYTTDGSAPSPTHGTVYSAPITVSTNTTFKAIAYKAGSPDSAVATGSYTFGGCFFAAGASGNTVVSTDGAQSWRALNFGNDNINLIAGNNRGGLLMVSRGASVNFISGDGGRKWQKKNGVSLGTVAFSPAGVWVGAYGPGANIGMMRSTTVDGSVWTSGTQAPGYVLTKSVAYVDGYGFVSVLQKDFTDYSTAIGHSTDGISWSSSTNNAARDQIFSVGGKVWTYGNGMQISGDGGYNWSELTLPTTYSLKSMQSGNGRHVAVGNMGTIIYSDNGTTWTLAASGTSANLVAVAHLNGRWAAIAANGFSYYSTDNAQTWSPGTPPTTVLTVNGMLTTSDRFTAYGANHLLMTSTDGITWTIRQHYPTNAQVNGMVLTSSKRLVLATTSGICYSDDYEAFYAATGVSSSLLSVTGIGSGTLAAIGSTARAYVSSDNGLTWSEQGDMFGSTKSGIASNGSKLIVTGWGSSIFSANIPATTWTAVNSDTAQWEDVTFANNQFMSAGYYGKIMYSNDQGVTWVNASVTGASSTDRLTGVEYGLGKWVAVGYNGKVYYSSNSGANWNFGSHGAGSNFEELAFGDGRFVGVGQGGYVAYSSDGINWQSSSTAGVSLFSVVHIPYP